jgi:hypothetical protein
MHAQFGTLTLRNIAIKLRWSNDGQLGMPATDTIMLAAPHMLQTLTWPTLQQRRLKTKLIMLYKIVLTPYRCSSYYNINTNRFKNRTISFFHIQTSSCIQRSVHVLLRSKLQSSPNQAKWAKLSPYIG